MGVLKLLLLLPAATSLPTYQPPLRLRAQTPNSPTATELLAAQATVRVLPWA
jgi:hypothetical protein